MSVKALRRNVSRHFETLLKSTSFSSIFPTKSHNLTSSLLFGAVFLSFKIAPFPGWEQLQIYPFSQNIIRFPIYSVHLVCFV